jgi:1-acyl-sn-glycerol-3-phosphate acyltransferase
VDAAVIVITCPRKVGFLVAEKSMKKAIIGDFARAVGSIGVARPQDYAKKGQSLDLLCTYIIVYVCTVYVYIHIYINYVCIVCRSG